MRGCSKRRNSGMNEIVDCVWMWNICIGKRFREIHSGKACVKQVLNIEIMHEMAKFRQGSGLFRLGYSSGYQDGIEK